MKDHIQQTERVQARYGGLHVHARPDLLSNSIRTYGEWAQAEIDVIRRFLKPGDVVLDVGSCLGTHAIAFADAVGPCGVVHAFEADPENAHVLYKNSAEPGRENISVHNVAVSSSNGSARLQRADGNVGAGHLLDQQACQNEETTVNVDTVTIDDSVWERIDLIKIDVEGHEPDVLVGATETLRRHHPILYIEVNKLDIGGICLTWLQQEGYRVFGDLSDPFNPNNYFDHPESIYSGGLECGLLCIHESRLSDWENVVSALAIHPIDTVMDLLRFLLLKPQFWHEELEPLTENLGLTQNGAYDAVVADNDARGRAVVDLNEQLAAHASEIAHLCEQRDGLLERLRSNTITLKKFETEWVKAMKVVRKTRSFPTSIYFNLRPRYRRLTRALLKSNTKLTAHLGHQQSMNTQTIEAVTGFRELAGLRSVNLDPADIQLCLENFDADYYLLHNRDVAEAAVDPFEHFMSSGWREKRNPNHWFDIEYYQTMRPDVVEGDQNPFLHYCKNGKHEGFLPAHPAGRKALILKEDSSHQATHYTTANATVLRSQEFVTALRLTLRAADNRLQMSFIHSDWLEAIGGTEVCMQIEAQECADSGIGHLSIYPVVQPYRLADPSTSERIVLGVTLNGDRIGTCDYDTIGKVITQVVSEGARIESTIHQLLGHQPEDVASLINSTGRPRAKYYLHDYLTICSQWNLLQNGISYCSAPKVDSGACGICRYGQDRALHQARIADLFDSIKMTLVSPSEIALQIWRDGTDLPVADTVVLPHVFLTSEPRQEYQFREPASPIRIGFVGGMAYNKGWDQFEELVDTYADDDRFSFHYFGSYPPNLNINHHKATVTTEDRSAMSSAIEQADMDLIVHVAPWPETFSFTAFESLKAGAYIITNASSGNVAAIVEKTGRGIVLDANETISDWLNSKACQALVARRRQDASSQLVHSEYSDMAVSMTRKALEA